MPHFVDDPESPGKKIDVHTLQERDPLRDLEPILIGHYLRFDSWTLRQALQLLAGYDPKTDWETARGRLYQTPPALHFYLDGLSSQLLLQMRLSHPRRTQNLSDINDLISWASNSNLEEKRTPREWIEWGQAKGFAPYWHDYAIKTMPSHEAGTPRRPEPADASNVKAVQAFAAQEASILARLHQMGVDPLAVPVAAPGKRHEVKRRIQDDLGYSNAQMNKAWTRLRADGRVKDA